MKKWAIILLLILGFVCMFFPYQVLGVNEMYIKTAGILLTMFSVYRLSSIVSSKEEGEDSSNFKF